MKGQHGMHGAEVPYTCTGLPWRAYACAASFALALAAVALTVTIVITRPLSAPDDYRIRFLVVRTLV